MRKSFDKQLEPFFHLFSGHHNTFSQQAASDSRAGRDPRRTYESARDAGSARAVCWPTIRAYTSEGSQARSAAFAS